MKKLSTFTAGVAAILACLMLLGGNFAGAAPSPTRGLQLQDTGSQTVLVAGKADICIRSCRGKSAQDRRRCLCQCDEGTWKCTTRPTVKCTCTFF